MTNTDSRECGGERSGRTPEASEKQFVLNTHLAAVLYLNSAISVYAFKKAPRLLEKERHTGEKKMSVL